MIPLMEKSGWFGRADEQDGGKSRDKGKKTGSKGTYTNWRLKTIYNTNMMTAFSAGRTRQMLRQAHNRPYWRYISLMKGDNRREQHKALHGSIFPYDDPFWQTYDAPNGWGCKCSKQSVSKSEMKRKGLTVKTLSDVPDDFKKSVPPEWRYSPGREAFAPDFSKYKYLAEYTMANGITALEQVKERYRYDMVKIVMRPGEWKTWSERVCSDDYKPEGFQTMAAVLNGVVYKQIDQDPKIMVTDSMLKNGINGFKSDLPAIHKTMSHPDKVLRSKNSFIFIKGDKAIFFNKTIQTTSLQFKSVKKLSEIKTNGYEVLYERA